MRRSPFRERIACAAGIALAPLFLLGAACGRGPHAPQARGAAVPLAVQVYADTGRGEWLPVRPLRARAWLARVTPARGPVPAFPPPDLEPDSLPALEESAPALEVDPGLKPPILRVPGVLALPPRAGRASVELEVHVDESGRVTEALAVGGSRDTAWVEAARRCALGMRFYPALRAGQPVAVWCRQRFDLGGDAR
jgi:hypothetical protein